MTSQFTSLRWLLIGCALAVVAGGAAVVAFQVKEVKEFKSGVVWPEPQVVDPGPVGGPPSDAVVLFDGKDLS
jgi:hypothetical protein